MTAQEAKNLIIKTTPKGSSAIDIQLRGALEMAIEIVKAVINK